MFLRKYIILWFCMLFPCRFKACELLILFFFFTLIGSIILSFIAWFFLIFANWWNAVSNHYEISIRHQQLKILLMEIGNGESRVYSNVFEVASNKSTVKVCCLLSVRWCLQKTYFIQLIYLKIKLLWNKLVPVCLQCARASIFAFMVITYNFWV